MRFTTGQDFPVDADCLCPVANTAKIVSAFGFPITRFGVDDPKLSGDLL
jgi:hypothetical protein